MVDIVIQNLVVYRVEVIALAGCLVADTVTPRVVTDILHLVRVPLVTDIHLGAACLGVEIVEEATDILQVVVCPGAGTAEVVMDILPVAACPAMEVVTAIHLQVAMVILHLAVVCLATTTTDIHKTNLTRCITRRMFTTTTTARRSASHTLHPTVDQQ